MKHLLRRRDTEAVIDGIIEGRPVDGNAGLDDVEAFLSDTRIEFGAMPAPEPRPTLASTLDGRRPLRPASSGPRTKPTIPDPRPRRHLFRPAAVVFASSAVLFGGLASAGALPGPVQRSTAELTSHVGIHLPGAPAAPKPSPDQVDPGVDVPRTGAHDAPSTTTQPPAGTTATMVPSVVPTTPTTLPTVPTTPTIPKLPLPVPRLKHLPSPLDPFVPLPGLTDAIKHSGVWPTDPTP